MILGDLWDEDKQLEPQVQLAIAQQVCEAMQALSCNNVVHRDLASRNVLVFKQLQLSDPSSVEVKVSRPARTELLAALPFTLTVRSYRSSVTHGKLCMLQNAVAFGLFGFALIRQGAFVDHTILG